MMVWWEDVFHISKIMLVLILVLVDDGMVGVWYLSCWLRITVLILVLVDDGMVVPKRMGKVLLR